MFNNLNNNFPIPQHPVNPSRNYMIIQSLANGSSVDRDGRIQLGDLLLAINDVALENKSSSDTTKLIDESPSDQCIRLTFMKPIDVKSDEQSSIHEEEITPEVNESSYLSSNNIVAKQSIMFDKLDKQQTLSKLAKDEIESSAVASNNSPPELRIIPDTPRSATTTDGFSVSFANAASHLHTPSSLPLVDSETDSQDVVKDNEGFVKPLPPATVRNRTSGNTDLSKPVEPEPSEILPSIIELEDISGKHLNT